MKNAPLEKCLRTIIVVAWINTTISSFPTIAAPVSKSPSLAGPRAKISEGWKFMAFAAPYGRFRAVTTADTTLIDNGVFRYSITAPDFETFRVLNPENKSYIQTTVSAYANQWAPSVKYPPLKKIGGGKKLGLECVHYTGESFRPGTTIDAWYTNAVPMEKGLSNSYSKLCGLPFGYGVPVRLEFIAPNGKTLMFELLTLTKTRVVAETLLVPKSYRYMKDQALFFFSDEDGSNTGIDEFMRWRPAKPANSANTGAKK
jgi:hypothetical protein